MTSSHITELRKARGWTQERLADASGVAVRTIQRMEAGIGASLETQKLVADALGVSVPDLVVDQCENPEPDSEDGEKYMAQKEARRQVERAWRRLFGAIGIVATMTTAGLVAVHLVPGQLFIVPAAYWAICGTIANFIQAQVLAPRLDRRYPLTAPVVALRSTQV